MRLIDADKYIDEREECGWLDDIAVSEFNRITPTIEAISIDDFEKYDEEVIRQTVQLIWGKDTISQIVAMLTEIQVGIGEHINPSNHTDSYEDGWSEGAEWCIDYIQEKINNLKAESEDKE